MMKNATFVYLEMAGTERESTWKSVRVNEKEYNVKSVKRLNPKLEGLEELLEEEKGQNRILVFKDFRPFRTKLDKLKLLKDNATPFHFINFRNLSLETLPAVIEVLEFNKQERSTKIKAGLEKRRKKGQILGNPNIGEKTGKIVKKRRLNSFKDQNNFNARKIIVELVENKGWSLNQVASYLNEKNHTTTKGGQFHAKTVQRLYEKNQELKMRFMPNSNLEDNYLDEEKKDKQLLKTKGLKENKNYEDWIEFWLLSPLTEEFEVIIMDNDFKDSNPVFIQVYSPEEKHIRINLDEQVLLPGLHYITIVAKEDKYAPIVSLRIKLRESLLVTSPL